MSAKKQLHYSNINFFLSIIDIICFLKLRLDDLKIVSIIKNWRIIFFKKLPNYTYEMILDLRKIVFFKKKKNFIKREIKIF